MKLRTTLAALAIAAAAAGIASPAAAQPGGQRYGSQNDEEARFEAASRRFEAELDAYQAAFDRYQQYRSRRPSWRDSRWDADDRFEQGYDPSRYYRTGPRYQERVLGPDERVYRGTDGRYYCKRSDGTTGLIIGAAAGGLLGNLIDGGHSRSAGTLIGALIGGAAGVSIERNQQEIRCR